MTSASITSNANLLAKAPVQAKAKDQDTSVDFMNVLNSNKPNFAESNNSYQPEVSATPTNKGNSDTSYEKMQSNSYRDDRITKSDNTTITTEKVDKPDESLDAQVVEVENEIKSAIKDAFDVSDEEIENAMEVLGLNYVSLLDKSNLASFVQELLNLDTTSELLTSTDFASFVISIDELNKTVEDLGIDINSLIDYSNVIETNDVIETMPNLEPVQESGGNIFASAFAEFMPEQFDLSQDVINSQQMLRNAEMLSQQILTNDDVTLESDEIPSFVSEEEFNRILGGDNQEELEQVEFEDVDDTNSFTQVDMDVRPEKSGENTSNSSNANSDSNQFNPFEAKPDFNQTVTDRVVPNADVTYTPETSTVTLPDGTSTRVADIIDQIVNEMRTNLTPETKSIEMILTPEGLGKVVMQVHEEGGEIKAKFFTQNEATRAALEDQMFALREVINSTQTRIQSIEVSADPRAFDENLASFAGEMFENEDARREEQKEKQRASQTSSINLNSLDDLSSLMSEEERLVAQMMIDNGETVNYKA